MSGKKNNVYDIFDKKEERRAIRKIFLFIGTFYVLTPIFVMMLILLLSLTLRPSFAIFAIGRMERWREFLIWTSLGL